jgi:hypothetical protein
MKSVADNINKSLAKLAGGNSSDLLDNYNSVFHKIISGTLTKGPTDAIYSNEIEPNDKFTFATAYYMNNSNDNSTITNATNSSIMENITGGDTITIPMKPSDKDNTLF